MDNKKIPTILGTIIIIIFAITAGMFVWKYEKNQPNAYQPQSMVQMKKDKSVSEGMKDSDGGQIEKENVSSDTSLADNSNDTNVDISKPFQYHKNVGFYGTLTLKGYLNIEHRICNPGDMCTKTVDYASLIITSADNNAIYGFLKDKKGNSFVGDNSVGIGCYESNNNRIYSENFDNKGKFKNIITGSALEKILKSSESNPVVIEMTSPYPPDGGSAPECYSLFRSFKISI